LEAQGEPTPRRPDDRPFVKDMMPSYDDEELGFSYFRYRLWDADNSDLTLPRTYFCRSGFYRVNFANTDLSESRMCWNDFEDCDFTGSDRSRCDMRASKFKGCKFVGATIHGADLRLSSFDGCDWRGADLTGAVAEDEAIWCLRDFVSKEQQAVMIWCQDSGPEPPGG
jgi:hypothetical protein